MNSSRILLRCALLFLLTASCALAQLQFHGRITEIFDPFGVFDSSVREGAGVTATFTFPANIPLVDSGIFFADYYGSGAGYSSAAKFGNYSLAVDNVAQTVETNSFTEFGETDFYELQNDFESPFLIFAQVVFPARTFEDLDPKTIPFGQATIGGEISVFYEVDGAVGFFDAEMRMTPVPEPSTYAAFAAFGLLGYCAVRRWRRTTGIA